MGTVHFFLLACPQFNAKANLLYEYPASWCVHVHVYTRFFFVHVHVYTRFLHTDLRRRARRVILGRTRSRQRDGSGRGPPRHNCVLHAQMDVYKDVCMDVYTDACMDACMCMSDFGFRVQSLGFRVSGFGFRVSGLGLECWGLRSRLMG